MLNKVAFGLAIFYAAGSQTELEKQVLVDADLPNVQDLLAQKMGNSTIESVAKNLQSKLKAAHARMDAGYARNRAQAAENARETKMQTEDASMNAMQQNAVMLSGLAVVGETDRMASGASQPKIEFTPRGSMVVNGQVAGNINSTNFFTNNQAATMSNPSMPGMPGGMPLSAMIPPVSVPVNGGGQMGQSPQTRTDVHMSMIR